MYTMNEHRNLILEQIGIHQGNAFVIYKMTQVWSSGRIRRLTTILPAEQSYAMLCNNR